MSKDNRKTSTEDTPPERRIAALRRRLAALRERGRAGAEDKPEAAEKVSWPSDLNAEPTGAGDWGRDPAEGDRE